LRAVGEPIDQAWLILYLASDAARWCTGQIWRVNGGQAMP
jgi:NAD(P)-dependent dehydrogenase (short-subunit alcohol dehydrogenase family)